MKMRLTGRQLAHLGLAYSRLDTITIENFKRLKGCIENLDTEALEQIADSNVRFVRTAANSLLVDRGIREPQARVDHAVNSIIESLRLQVA